MAIPTAALAPIVPPAAPPAASAPPKVALDPPAAAAAPPAEPAVVAPPAAPPPAAPPPSFTPNRLFTQPQQAERRQPGDRLRARTELAPVAAAGRAIANVSAGRAGCLGKPLGCLGELEPHLVASEQARLARLGERHPPAHQQRLHGGQRRAHRLGDLRVGEVVDLAQDHRGPLRLRKLLHVGDDLAQLLPLLDLLEGRRPVLVRMDVHRVLALGDRPPQEVQAAVAGDPVEPRAGLDRPLVGDHRRVGGDEDLLQHVLGVLRRVEQVPAERQQAGLVTVEQDLERPIVPVANQGDELLVALQPKQRRAASEQPAMRCRC